MTYSSCATNIIVGGNMGHNNKYYRLWKKLDELNMTKKELEYMAHLPRFTLYKMKIGLPVSLKYLIQICNTVHCELEEILGVEEN